MNQKAKETLTGFLPQSFTDTVASVDNAALSQLFSSATILDLLSEISLGFFGFLFLFFSFYASILHGDIFFFSCFLLRNFYY